MQSTKRTEEEVQEDQYSENPPPIVLDPLRTKQFIGIWTNEMDFVDVLHTRLGSSSSIRIPLNAELLLDPRRIGSRGVRESSKGLTIRVVRIALKNQYVPSISGAKEQQVGSLICMFRNPKHPRSTRRHLHISRQWD